MTDDAKLRVTKIDAACRQLDCAIDLWFHDKDQVSVHTLTAAAYQIIHDVNQHRGTGKKLFYDSDLVVEERRKEWIKIVKEPVNFFKHADKDPEGSIEFSAFGNLTFMVFSMLGLHAMGHPLSHSMDAFQHWILIHRPDLVSKAFRERFYDSVPVDEIEAIRMLPKDKFFESCLGARALRWNRNKRS